MEATVSDVDLLEGVFGRIGSDLEAILDHEILFEEVQAARVTSRVAGRDQVHISFKLGIQCGEHWAHGSLLVPLPEAISMACFLMMAPDDVVENNRDLEVPDDAMKDAMLEVGNFVAGAADAVLRSWAPEGGAVRSEGCQGVRADIRPVFPHEEGDELIVGRVRASLHTYSAFEMILMLPAGCLE
jgi:hypothetical protein